MSSRRSPGRVSWSSSPPPGPGRCWPRPPQPAAGSWACSPARLPATRPGCAWTGTSARRCARWPRPGPAARPCCWRPGCPEAGQAALAITGRGAPAAALTGRAVRGVRAGAAARRRPGRHHRQHTRPGGLRDDPGEVIAAARAAGLVYAQHIVALHAAITDGQLTPGSPGRRPPGRGRRPPGRPRPHPQRPARVHQARRNPAMSRPPPPARAPARPRQPAPGQDAAPPLSVWATAQQDARDPAPRPVPARRHRPPRQDAARDRRHRDHPLQRARGPGRRPDVRHRHHPGRGHPPRPRRHRRGVRAPVGAARRREHHLRPPPRRAWRGGGDPR